MTEGVFPKSDGDIAYASEYNRFAGASRGFFMGSMVPVGSKTGIQETGSVIIGAGSLTNPTVIDINYITKKPNAETMFGIGISGMSVNKFMYLGSNTAAVNYGNTKIFCGSSTNVFTGIISSTIYDSLFGQKLFSATTSVTKSDTITDLDTEQDDIVLFFNISGVVASASTQFIGVHVQGYRGGM